PLRPAGLGRGRNRHNHRRDQRLLVRCSRHTTSLALNSNWSSGRPDPSSRPSAPPPTPPHGRQASTAPISKPRRPCSTADVHDVKQSSSSAPFGTSWTAANRRRLPPDWGGGEGA